MRPGISNQLSAAYIVDRSEINPVFHSVPLELAVVVHKDLSICVVDGDSLGIATFRLATLASVWPAARNPASQSRTLRSWLLQLLLGFTVLAMWGMFVEKWEYHADRGQKGRKTPSWRAREEEPGTQARASRGLTWHYAARERGRRYLLTPCPSGWASRTESDHVPLPMRHSPG